MIVRLRLSINTDATAVANHSDGLLSSVEVDVPRFTMFILSKNVLYACSDNALHFPRAYVSVSLWECPKLLANVCNVSRKTVRREMSWSAQARDSLTERAYRSLIFVRAD